MITLKRLLINICSEDLERSKEFYTSFFDFEVTYDSDWFVHMTSKDSNLEFALIVKDHELVPMVMNGKSGGFYVSFIVENVDKFHALARDKGVTIVGKPADTFYGQRRMLIKDPDGNVLDISSPTANDGE